MRISDIHTIRENLKHIDNANNDINSLEKKVKTEDQQRFKQGTNRVKTGMKTGHHFNQAVISQLIEIKKEIKNFQGKLVTIRDKLNELTSFRYGCKKSKSRSIKQNKHRAKKRNQIRHKGGIDKIRSKICKTGTEECPLQKIDISPETIKSNISVKDQYWLRVFLTTETATYKANIFVWKNLPESVKEALKKTEDESSEHSSGGTTDNDSIDDVVDDLMTVESVSMEPEDTTGIEESDIETMADASVEQMDSSQNMDDSGWLWPILGRWSILPPLF